MLRIFAICWTMIVAGTLAAIGQNSAITLYAHDSKIIDLRTGLEGALLKSRPPDANNCPENWFYRAGNGVVVRCNSGEKFKLAAPPKNLNLPKNSKVLIPVTPGGTDDPGPSIKR